MDLSLLSRFVTIAECGSVSQAARTLRVSQPTLTWSVQQLEGALNARLLERSAKGVTLTPAGEALHARARVIVREAERAKADVAAVVEKRNAELVVAATPPFLSGIISRAVLRTLEALPTLNLRLVQLDAGELHAALQAARVDVGFWNPRAGLDLDQLDFETTFTETYVLAARATHPVFRSRRPVTLQLALEHGWVMHESAYRTATWDASGKAGGIPRPTVRLQVNSEHLMRLMILDSDLLGYVAQDMIQRDVDEGTLRVLPIPELTVRTRAGLLVRKDAIYTPAMKLFCREIRMACRHARRG